MGEVSGSGCCKAGPVDTSLPHCLDICAAPLAWQILVVVPILSFVVKEIDRQMDWSSVCSDANTEPICGEELI